MGQPQLLWEKSVPAPQHPHREELLPQSSSQSPLWQVKAIPPCLVTSKSNRGLGRRKVEPERRQQNSQNFFLWAHEPVPSREDGLTIYQTSFMNGKSSESPIYTRYPKDHTEKQCIENPIPEKERNLQPNKKAPSTSESVVGLYLKQLTASVLTEV
uniref:Domain of unknown function with conserved HDNR motif domain-containing protein n=1 Tax=Strigops habroptila TaxID=2489341 RepID=A0A672TST7_STRHB